MRLPQVPRVTLHWYEVFSPVIKHSEVEQHCFNLPSQLSATPRQISCCHSQDFAYRITFLMAGCFCPLDHYCFFASDLPAINAALHSSLPFLPPSSVLYLLDIPSWRKLGNCLGFFFQCICHCIQCYMVRVWLPFVSAVTKWTFSLSVSSWLSRKWRMHS